MARLEAPGARLTPRMLDGRSARLDAAQLNGYRELRQIEAVADKLGITDPFFRVHDGIAGAETIIAGRRIANFASYDYLALNGDPRVTGAAKAAIDRYGTTVSASRTVSGERPIHRELEDELARLYDADDAITLVSGHATNVSLIGTLLGSDDLVVHDALAHNSIAEGARLSGARRLPFRHLDVAAADRTLSEARSKHGKALIVIEGHYSMDGDVPDLAAFVALARRHHAWLMVDEAHALGALGRRGFGLAEHTGVDPREVDIWMGTLSKSLVSTGGYIAGSSELIGYLKRALPGFVFSVGMAPHVIDRDQIVDEADKACSRAPLEPGDAASAVEMTMRHQQIDRVIVAAEKRISLFCPVAPNTATLWGARTIVRTSPGSA